MDNISFAANLNLLGLAIGWIIAGFILVLEIFILWFIWIGTTKKDGKWDSTNRTWYGTKGINIEYLLSNEKGDASFSRFQFLIFTFVIAMSLFYIIVQSDPPSYPETIPWEILGLIGISGGSYVLGKSIDASRETASGTAQPSDSKTTTLESLGSQSATSGPLVQVVTNGSQVGIRGNTSAGKNGSQVSTVVTPAREELKLGSSGPDVEKLQQQLQQLGFLDSNLINGVFGPETESAVKAFQASRGITSDGIVNSSTIDALGLNS